MTMAAVNRSAISLAVATHLFSWIGAKWPYSITLQ